MKAVFVLALIALFAVIALAGKAERQQFYEKMVESINSSQNLWTAELNTSMVEGLVPVKNSLGALFTPKSQKKIKTSGWKIATGDLPTNFFAADKWTNCSKMMRTVHDQSACGSCWAVSAAAAASERHCIKANTPGLFLSARDLLSCCSQCGDGCEGGWPDAAWSYFVESGLPTGSPDSTDKSLCVRYPFLSCKHHTEGTPQCSDYDFSTPTCQRSCDADSTWPVKYADDKVKFKDSFSVYGETNMMKELVENGPMTVAYSVYEDFMQYKSGIYSHKTGRFLGGHAVTLEGYGVDAVTGTKYWIVKNNWNSAWGESGYFRIVRGTDECGIESEVDAGTP